jgi:hypothetical protein
MKFKPDVCGVLSAKTRDNDGDKVGFEIFPTEDADSGSYAMVIRINNDAAVGITRRQARKLAKAILKETEK